MLLRVIGDLSVKDSPPPQRAGSCARPSARRRSARGPATRRGGRNAMTFYRDVPDDMLSATDVSNSLIPPPKARSTTAGSPPPPPVVNCSTPWTKVPTAALMLSERGPTVAAMAAVIDALPHPLGEAPLRRATTPVRPRRRTRAKWPASCSRPRCSEPAGWRSPEALPGYPPNTSHINCSPTPACRSPTPRAGRSPTCCAHHHA